MIWYLFLESFRSEQKIGKNASKKFFLKFVETKRYPFSESPKMDPSKKFPRTSGKQNHNRKNPPELQKSFFESARKVSKMGVFRGY